MIKGSVPYVPGVLGSSFFGKNGFLAGPCKIYLGSKTATTLTGTVEGTSGSGAITGTGTSFTDLEVGQYVSFGAGTSAHRVSVITSDTAMTVTPALSADVAALTAIKRVHVIDLGDTDMTNLKWSLQKSDMKSSQRGDGAADRMVSFGAASVEIGAAMSTLERMAAMYQGFDIQHGADGPVAGAFAVPIGQMDSDITQELHLVSLIGVGLESSDPLAHVTCYKAAATIDSEIKRDASGQIFLKTMFQLYADPSHMTPNGAALFSVGPYTFI